MAVSSLENRTPLGRLIERMNQASRRAWALKSKVVAVPSAMVYGWYAGQLLTQVKSRRIPTHVAMILDGNRRYARGVGFADVTEGYRYGAMKVNEVVKWCDELKIPVVTLWGLSTDNLKRSPEELEKFFLFLSEKLQEFSKDPYKSRRIRVVGRVDLLPPELRESIKVVERQTANTGPWQLNVALAYGGRDEILDAFKRVLHARGAQGESAAQIADSLCAGEIDKYLYAPDVPEPELIIRTSGEVRLSGFMLWQSVYSELYFCDSLWPAFRKIDFLRCVRSFQSRRRRYGQ